MNTSSIYSKPLWLALFVVTAMLQSPRSVAAQVPHGWMTTNFGYGSASTGGLLAITNTTAALRIRDSTAFALTFVGSSVQNIPSDSLGHSPRTLGGVVASILFVGCSVNALCDRLGQTMSVGVGAFQNIGRTSTRTTRPGLQLGFETPIVRAAHFDMTFGFVEANIPEPHGHVESIVSMDWGLRVF